MKLFYANISAILNIFIFATFSFAASETYIFKPRIHKDINKKMLKKVLEEFNLNPQTTKMCQNPLTRSQTFQDIFLFFNSKAHFDNCAFQRSLKYINRLTARNEELARKYEKEFATKKRKKRLNSLRQKILFNTGKILHAVQDFYSHSNYENTMSEHQNLENIPIIHFWLLEKQNKIFELEKKGLVSGKVWWTFPQKCPKKTLSHRKMAKDSEKYISGKETTKWKHPITKNKLNGYQVARYLAEKSTYQFLLHTFNKYPMLKEYCGTKKLR